ncbi:MAG: Cys-tRNA(Pro) deacylase [Desulfuromonadaceae bacterium]|nr:Cys-tRNA(Pro) deacylase [Desulfuromonadaceae bacterium]
MAKDKIPATPALRLLRQQQVDFIPRPYSYEEKGGTAVSARQLGVAEHNVIKTLIMEDDARQPLIVLMHGDCEVSTKELARLIGVKSIRPCDPKTADRHSGYQVGGTSPFATRKKMPVYLERTILELDRIYLNGGKRGLLVEINPRAVCELLQPELVAVAIS